MPSVRPIDADGPRFHPYGAADLVAQAANGAQHAEFATPIGDRNGERVDDAEYRNQHGDHYLDIGEAEPLVHDLGDVSSDFTVEHHEQVTLPADAFDNAAAHFFLRSAGLVDKRERRLSCRPGNSGCRGCVRG